MTQDFMSAVQRYERDVAQATLDYERRLSDANRRLQAAMLAFENDRRADADTAKPATIQSARK